MWEAETGYNALGAEVRVAADGVSAGSTKRMTYVGSDAVIANPDRGVIAFHSPEASNDDIQWQGPLSAPETQDYLNTLRDTTGATTVRVIYISATTARRRCPARCSDGSGTTSPRRVAWATRSRRSSPTAGSRISRATPPRTRTRTGFSQHLDQLTPILEENTDVMSFMFAGFIGPWGE